MIEEWRPVKGYETHYAVSNLGRVKSLDRVAMDRRGWPRRLRGRVLVLNPLQNKYYQIRLCLDGVNVCCYVHRLVACAFIGEPPHSESQVNHLDFDGLNNRFENLEWADPKENIQHSHRARHFCPVENKNFQYKLKPEQVLEIRGRAAAGESRHVLADHFGVHHGHISAIVNRRKWVNL